MRTRLVPLVVIACLAGCHKGTQAGGDDHSAADNAAPVSTAAAPAAPAPNTMSIDVPGLKGSVSLPTLSLPGKNTDIDGMRLYPGTQLTGMAVAGDETAHGGEGGVSMRYTAPAAPGAVIAFYSHAAQAAGFTLGTISGDTLHASKGAKTAVTIVARPADGGSAGTISVAGS